MSTRARALLALLAAVLVGAATGVAADRAWLAAWSSPIASDESLVAAMRHEVGLDANQERRVREIVARHQHAVDSAWTQVRPNVHAAISAAQMEIAMVLRPDQRARYRAWIRSEHRSVPSMADSALRK